MWIVIEYSTVVIVIIGVGVFAKNTYFVTIFNSKTTTTIKTQTNSAINRQPTGAAALSGHVEYDIGDHGLLF